jgi:hypothetical protein
VRNRLAQVGWFTLLAEWCLHRCDSGDKCQSGDRAPERSRGTILAVGIDVSATSTSYLDLATEAAGAFARD